MMEEQKMKKILLSVLAVILMSIGGSALMAKAMSGGPGGGCFREGMPMGMGYHLNMLQADLKLTDEQVDKIHKIDMDYAEKFYQSRKDTKESDKLWANHRSEIEKVLTKEQLEKWKEFRGPRYGMGNGMHRWKDGSRHGMMHNYLNLTDEQSVKIHKINREYHDKFFENRKDEAKIEKLREEHRKEAEKILTKEQLEKLKEFKKNHRGMGFGPGFEMMY